MPTHTNEDHAQLQERIIQYGVRIGFKENYDHLSPSGRCPPTDHFSYSRQPDAKYIRTVVKDIVFHNPDTDFTAQVDAKTSGWKHGNHFDIEAIPFLHACDNFIRFGYRTLFACKRLSINEEAPATQQREYGIVADYNALKRVEKISYPRDSWEGPEHADLRHKHHALPNRVYDDCGLPRPPYVFQNCGYNASHHPHVCLNVDHAEVPVPHWKEVLDEWVTIVPPGAEPEEKPEEEINLVELF